MPTLTPAETSGSILEPTAEHDRPDWQVVLCSEPERRWPLPTGRFTVGSSPQCQIHLEADEVRPLHCLVSSTDGELQITRWADGALLNGEVFSLAKLKSGDVLSIGPFELRFELLAAEEPAAVTEISEELTTEETAPPEVAEAETAEPEPAQNVEPVQPIVPKPVPRPRHTTGDPAARRDRDRKLQRLWTANFQARNRCRQLIDAMRSLRSQTDETEQRITSLSGQLHFAIEQKQEVARQLDELQESSANEKKSAAAELERLIGEVTAAYEKANAVEASVAETERRNEDLQQELSASALERQRAQRLHIEQVEKCEALTVELAEREQNVQALRDELQQSEQTSRTYREKSVELSSQLAELQAEVARHHEQYEFLTAAHTDATQRLSELEETVESRDRSIGSLQLQLEETCSASDLLRRESEETITALRQESDETISTLRRESEGTITALRQELEDLQQRQETLQDSEAVHTAELEALRAEIKSKSETLASLNAEKQRLEAVAAEAEAQNSKFVLTIEQLHNDMQVKEDQRLHLSNFQDEAIQRLESLEQELSDRQTRLEALEGELSQKAADEKVSLEKLSVQSATIETLESKLQSLESLREQLEENKDASTCRVIELQESLSSTEQRLEELTTEHQRVCESLQSVQTEKSEADCRLQKLQPRLSETEQILNELCTEHERVSEVLSRVEVERADATTRLEELQQTCSCSQQSLEQLQVEHQRVLENLNAAEAEKNLAAERLETLQQELTDREQSLERLQAEHQEVYETLHNFEEGAFKEVEANKKLQEQVEAIRSERDELAAQQNSHDQSIEQLQQALAQREGEITQLQKDLEVLTQRRGEAEQQADEKSQLHQQLEMECEELRSRCDSLTEQATAGRLEQHELEEQLSQRQEEIARLSAQLEESHRCQQELQQEVEELAAIKQHHSEEVAQWQEKLQDLDQQYQQEIEQRKLAAQEAARHRERCELLEVDLKSTQGELSQNGERLQSLEKERTEIQQQLESLQEKFDIQAKMQEALAEGNAEAGTERDALVEERDQLTEQLEKLQSECDSLREQMGEAEQATPDNSEQLAELEQAKVELEARVETLQADLDRVVAELEQRASQIGETESQLSEMTSRYEASQQDLAAAQQCLAQAEQALLQLQESQANAEPTTQVSQESSSLLSREELPEEPAPISEEVTAGEGDSQDSAADALDHLRELSVWKDTEPSATETFEKPEESPYQESAGESAEEEEAAEFQPTSFIQQYGHLLSEDRSEDEASDRVAREFGIEEDLPTKKAEPPSQENEQFESDDEALEAYMQNMMERVRGGAETSATEELPAHQTALTQRFAQQEVLTPEELAKPFDLESLRGSSNKPPLPTDIRAMRELANSSARGAIARHHKRLNREAIFTKLSLCATAIAVAIYMMISAENFTSSSFLGGAFSVLVAVLWGVKFLGHLRQAIRGAEETHSSPASPPDDDQDAPLEELPETDELDVEDNR